MDYLHTRIFAAKKVAFLLLLLAFVLFELPAKAESSFIETMKRRGCGGGKGVAMSTAEMRFTNLRRSMTKNLFDKISTRRTWGLPDIQLIKNELWRRFESRRVSCKVKLFADGSIAESVIYETSHIEEVDKKALALITESAPYRKNPTEIDRTYIVNFPFLEITDLK